MQFEYFCQVVLTVISMRSVFLFQGGWRLEGPVFPTIQHLLEHQIMKGQPVTNKSQAILKNPILREPWELKNDDILLEMKIGNVSTSAGASQLWFRTILAFL